MNTPIIYQLQYWQLWIPLFGGIRAHLQNIYDEKVFVSGFFFNIILAASLAFLGVHLGVDLYLAAVFAFGVRLFQNIAVIRRIFIDKMVKYSRKNRKKLIFNKGNSIVVTNNSNKIICVFN